MLPGHTYGFKDSDYTTWSYNDASKDRGMIELYTEGTASNANGPAPAPAASYTSRSSSAGYTVPSALSVGQTFKLGEYEQDNNTGNGTEPIEWQVLAVKGDRALVISRYVLDARPIIMPEIPGRRTMIENG